MVATGNLYWSLRAQEAPIQHWHSLLCKLPIRRHVAGNSREPASRLRLWRFVHAEVRPLDPYIRVGTHCLNGAWQDPGIYPSAGPM